MVCGGMWCVASKRTVYYFLLTTLYVVTRRHGDISGLTGDAEGRVFDGIGTSRLLNC